MKLPYYVIICNEKQRNMAVELAPENRQMSLTVNDLKAHVQCKIDELPRLALRFHLDEKAIGDLRAHLQREVDYYGTLPPE